MAATMQQGKDKFLLFRRLKDADKEKASRLVFQTSHTFEYNRTLDRVMTKDGSVVRAGGLEANVSIEAIQAVGDEVAAFLEQSVLDGEKLELWEVTFDEDAKNEDGEYPAVYAQGYLESWSVPADVDGEATISTNFVVDMTPQKGYTALEEGIEEAAQYAFRDTDVYTGEDTP